jgi:membrane associated rhomboid family serine protease
MGIYDREYYREEPRGFFLGGQTMVMNLVIINVAIYLVDWLIFQGQLYEWIGLQPDLFQRPWNAWQLVTYGFAHDAASVWHVAFNMLALWFFGREIEMFYGRREFLSFYLTGVMVSGLAWVLAETFLLHGTKPLVGASGGVLATVILFVIHYPTKSIYFWGIFPIPAWLLAALYLLGDLQGFQRSVEGGGMFDPTGYAAHLGGAAYGALYYKLRWSLGKLLPAKFSLKSLKSLKARPSLKLHEPWREEVDLDQRVDEILDKIGREGEASLTRDERRTLEEASRRYQKKRR